MAKIAFYNIQNSFYFSLLVPFVHHMVDFKNLSDAAWRYFIDVLQSCQGFKSCNTNFYALHSASPYISYVVICVVIPTRKQEFITENWTKNTNIKIFFMSWLLCLIGKQFCLAWKKSWIFGIQPTPIMKLHCNATNPDKGVLW